MKWIMNKQAWTEHNKNPYKNKTINTFVDNRHYNWIPTPSVSGHIKLWTSQGGASHLVVLLWRQIIQNVVKLIQWFIKGWDSLGFTFNSLHRLFNVVFLRAEHFIRIVWKPRCGCCRHGHIFSCILKAKILG